MIALAFLLVVFAGGSAMAAQGDCGQPVSNGSQPTASDCLFILRAAVGSEICDPDCVCDTNGAGGTSASDALVCLKKAVGQAVALACPCSFGAAGDETQLNTYTSNDQRRPSVGTDADGNFIVAWESTGSTGNDSDATSVQVRRFLSDGSPVGAQSQVNTFTTSFQSFVSLAANDDGEFVAAWSNSGGNPSDTTNSVRARLFDSGGAPVGDDFQVNTYTTGSQTVPSVGMDAEGNFVVVWQGGGSSGTDSSPSSIQGQRFDAGGAPVGTEFQVNTYTTDSQTAPAISVAPGGEFVVVWTSAKSGTLDADGSIQGQRFDQDGVAVGTEFTVNTYTTGAQVAPEVAVDTSGGFVVVWNSAQSAGPDDANSVQGRRYDANGAPLGAEFQVNAYTSGTQAEASIAALNSGAFVVVWYSTGGSSGTDSDYSVVGQAFDAGGAVFGTEFQVNTYTAGYQLFADAAPRTGGGFVVVWQSQGSSGSDSESFSIQGQRYE